MSAPTVAAAAPDGRNVYVKHCAVCHGESGNGHSRASNSLIPPPRDFTRAETAAELTPERMRTSITHGRPGTAMMAFSARLTPADIDAVIAYIRHTFMYAAPSAQPATDAATADRGERIYVRHCAACHGDRGESAVWARNGLSPPPRDFTAPAAREELSRERMLTSVTHGRPGTAMMPFQSRLPPGDIVAVVAFIRARFMGQPTPGAVAHQAPAPPHAADMAALFPSGLQGNVGRGRDFFMNNCYTCHGRGGKGDGPRAHFNQPRPRDFTAADSRQHFNRPRLFAAIRDGKRGTVMPAWGKVLTPQQIADVGEYVFRAYIRADLKKTESGSDPALGRRVYNTRCYFCHGYNGDARTIAASYLSPGPRDFTAISAGQLSRARMVHAVTEGRSGTAMQAFAGILSAGEIGAVVDYVRGTFLGPRRHNADYHTPANGWLDHGRYAGAFPFVTGELSADAPDENLTAAQRDGRRIFVAACISCHEPIGRAAGPVQFELRPVSYPRNGYVHTGSDSVSGASAYARHDQKPHLADLTPQERHGEDVYQRNCAFCHAADGTAANWIARFIEPHPRDFTRVDVALDRVHLRRAIRDGVAGSAMPAWKGVLTDPDIDAVIAYIARAFAAGKV